VPIVALAMVWRQYAGKAASLITTLRRGGRRALRYEQWRSRKQVKLVVGRPDDAAEMASMYQASRIK